MISSNTDTFRFQLRAAVVVMRDDAVLLHSADGDVFWALLGGRVEAGEAAADAAVREMKEELSVEVTSLRFTWLAENFFTHQGKVHHEVGLYFCCEANRRKCLA